jgi:hypothetical protein
MNSIHRQSMCLYKIISTDNIFLFINFYVQIQHVTTPFELWYQSPFYFNRKRASHTLEKKRKKTTQRKTLCIEAQEIHICKAIFTS